MKKLFLSALAVLLCFSASAKVELTPLFSDNMVFQQNCQAPVWGKAAPGKEISVVPSWNGKTYRATADAQGKWMVKIDTPRGSFKKYSLTVSDGEPVVLQNVLVGEVWLASGQSNMQMPVESWRDERINQEDIQGAAKYSGLRLLQVSRATGMKEHDYFSADFDKWKESAPETVRNFSAAAWYFGRKLMEELKVPVGVIHSSWGGTIIEAWMSEGAIGLYPEMAASLAQVKSLSDNVSDRERTFDEEIEAFTREATLKDHGKSAGVAVWARPGLDDSSWKSIQLPCMVQELWPSVNGIFWFRKTVEIPAVWAGKDLTLSLGPVDDFDETYWDGELVGSGELWNKAREYTVPARLVKEGKTVITIRCTDDHGEGGIYGARDLLYIQGPDGQKIYAAFNSLAAFRISPPKELWERHGGFYHPNSLHEFVADMLEVTPDGKYLLFHKVQPNSEEDMSVRRESRIWVADADTGEILRSLEGHSGAVTAVCAYPDSVHCVTAGEDNRIIKWDLTTGPEGCCAALIRQATRTGRPSACGTRLP